MAGNGRRLIPVILVLSMLLTGCYNSRELNDLAIVSGIGVDWLPDKEEFLVSFQTVNPSSTATSTGAGSSNPSITVISASDSTIFGALRKSSKRSTRQLFFAHTQLLVIGESLAERGVQSVFDIFERSHELRLNSQVIVSRGGTAADILKILSPIESLPAFGLIKKTNNSSQVFGENRTITVANIIRNLTGEGDFTINGIRIIGDADEGKKKTNLEQSEPRAATILAGLAVFKQGKLKSWVEGPDARGTEWVLNRIEETVVNIDAPDAPSQIAVNIFLSKTTKRVEIKDNIPIFHVSVREEGIVNETEAYINLSDKTTLQKLGMKLAEKTKKEISDSVQAAQQLKCDIFGFGDELERTKPDEWKRVKENWGEMFAKGKLDLRVEAYIRGTGMRLKPYMPAGGDSGTTER